MPTEEQIKKYEELTEHNIIRIATKGKEGYEAWVGLTGDKKTNVPQMKIEMHFGMVSKSHFGHFI